MSGRIGDKYLRRGHYISTTDSYTSSVCTSFRTCSTMRPVPAIDASVPEILQINMTRQGAMHSDSRTLEIGQPLFLSSL